MKNRSHTRGFTLTEIAIVLGIGGFIISAVWVGISAVNQRQAVKHGVDTLQTIAHNFVSIYQNRTTLPAYCGAVAGQLTASLIDAGIIPADSFTGIDASGCKAAGHPWAETPGRLIVWGPGNASVAADAFRISFYNIPLAACIALLMEGTNCDPTQPGCPFQVFTNLGGSGFITPNVGPPLNWQGQITATTGMSPTQAQTLCNFNAGGGSSLEFDYRH